MTTNEQKPMSTGEALGIVYEMATIAYQAFPDKCTDRIPKAIDIVYDFIVNNFNEDGECPNSR